jgi:site-specific recombinase XerD
MTTNDVSTTTPPALPATITTIPLDRNPAAVYLARLALGSRRTMHRALDTCAALLTSGRADALSCDWPALRSLLAARYAAATANKHLAALRGVLRECGRLGLMTPEEERRAASLPGVRGSTLPRGRALSAGELRALFGACADGTPAGARDAALCAVLYGCGRRRVEAVALALADVEPETGAITVRVGKGNKQRVVYAANGGGAALRAWLAVRGDKPGPLFWPIDRRGRLTPRQLSDQAVLLILRRRAARAHVAGFSPHDLRRSMISDLLDAGADISTVQRLAGHANVTTTQRYDRRGEASKRTAASLIHVPYRVA